MANDTDMDIDPAELVKILKSTKNLGLMELTYKGLNLKFFNRPQEIERDYRLVSTTKAYKNDARQLEFNELHAKEDTIEEMMIADPQQYEELLSSQELVEKDE